VGHFPPLFAEAGSTIAAQPGMEGGGIA